MLKILVVGSKTTPYLMGSYARAFASMGHQVDEFDLEELVRKKVPFGRVGRALSRALMHEPWIVAANRELIVRVRKGYDLVVVPGMTNVRAGALGQIKASAPGTKLALLWPDTLLNIGSTVSATLPLYDCVASYSSAAILPLKRMGAQHVSWVPFAADHLLFTENPISEADRREFGCQVCFVGNVRPEREQAIVSLIRSGFEVRVWGNPIWLSAAQDKSMAKKYYMGRELQGNEMRKAFQCAKICLNVIDDTNFPAANMRTFEAAACGAAILTSPCPELSDVLRDGEACLTFHSEGELVSAAKRLASDEALRDSIARTANRIVLASHTYVHRAAFLLAELGLSG